MKVKLYEGKPGREYGRDYNMINAMKNIWFVFLQYKNKEPSKEIIRLKQKEMLFPRNSFI